MKYTAMLLVLIAHALAIEPQVRVVVAERGLDEISRAALTIVNAELSAGVGLPDMHLDEHVPEPIGHITLDLTDIRVTKGHLESAQIGIDPVAPSPGAGTLELQLSGLTLEVTLGYKWRKVHFPHASDHGTVDAQASSGSASLRVSLSPVAGAQPHASGNGSATIGGFDVHFHGKVSWLYNIFTNLFEGTIRKAVQSAISTTLEMLANEKLNALLQALPHTWSFGGGKSRTEVGLLVTDLRTSQSPLALSIGDAFDVHDPMLSQACPLPAKILPTLAPRGANMSMAQVLIADTTLACAAWVSWRNHALNIPGVHAGTTVVPWGPILPKLALHEGNKPVVLHLFPSKEPAVVSNATTGLRATVGFLVNSSVLEADNVTLTYTHALTVSADFGIALHVNATATGTNATLVGNVTDLKLNATVSDCGVLCPMPGVTLKLFVAAFEGQVRQALNQLLAHGIPISPGGASPVRLLSPTVSFNDGFFAIATDFRFGPSSEAS